MKFHSTLIFIPLLAALLLTLANCDTEEPVNQPTLSTLSVINITANTARSGGNITSNGGGNISSRGVVWSTSPNPTAEQNNGLTMQGGDIGEFISEITGLTPGTTYYLRAYATNVAGMVYGNEQQFSTEGTPPEITTIVVINITSYSAESGGIITNDGGAPVSSRGVVWNTLQNPSLESNYGSTSDGNGTGSFKSYLMGLSANTTYYVRSYAVNDAGMVYGNEQLFTTEKTPPVLTTNAVTNITSYSAESGGNITNDGGAPITVRGIVWSKSSNPTIYDSEGYTIDGNGLGQFTSTITGLAPETPYYARAYASNSLGTGYGQQENFTSKKGDNTQIVEVISPGSGKTWMDRNLGASRAATGSTDEEAYGDLYQWGRAADGHQKKTSLTTTALCTGDTPVNGKYILASNEPHDWRSPQNSKLWQGVNGINNPCPTGYRVPTQAELNAELQIWRSNDAAGAIASPLKLPSAGYRNHSTGSLDYVDTDGKYWSSTADGIYSRVLYISNGVAGMGSHYRADGLSVRCIKDD